MEDVEAVSADRSAAEVELDGVSSLHEEVTPPSAARAGSLDRLKCAGRSG
jgi:hypothetical protein